MILKSCELQDLGPTFGPTNQSQSDYKGVTLPYLVVGEAARAAEPFIL